MVTATKQNESRKILQLTAGLRRKGKDSRAVGERAIPTLALGRSPDPLFGDEGRQFPVSCEKINSRLGARRWRAQVKKSLHLSTGKLPCLISGASSVAPPRVSCRTMLSGCAARKSAGLSGVASTEPAFRIRWGVA